MRGVVPSNWQNRVPVPVLSISFAVPGVRSAVLPALAANDPGSTRLVYAMVAGLVLVGVVLVVLGVWLVRQTRYDPPVLAPLERMGDSSWRKRDPATQRRILDEVRPEGAEPLAAGTQAPALDAEFEDAGRSVSPLDDLGPGVGSPASDPPEAAAAEPAEAPDDATDR